MEKGKKIEAANGEILLPEAIIQHIQSFLSGKQAAQTSILSKSWYRAWSTRPNLDFDQREFRKRGDEGSKSQITNGFPKFAKKTMQRYQELNLKIESLRLWMKYSAWGSYSLANELIVKAIKMGASDLNFEFQYQSETFVLPHEVLGAETLIRLSATMCKIDRGVDGKVSCSRLKSLSLHRVHTGEDIIRDIISSCPLIENFLLSECKCLYKVQRDGFDRTRTRMFALSPSIEFGKQNVGSVVDGLINLSELHKLKCLLLEKVKISSSFFDDVSTKFPCLKDLTLNDCVGFKGIRISSRSLEYISFAQKRMLRANLDVPSIRLFKLSSSNLPSLSFETASREWESDISVSTFYLRPRHMTSWFLKLNKFLKKLRLSKISLSLKMGSFSETTFGYAGDIQGLPKPVVENLMLTTYASSSVCSAIFDGLFWSCRPKFITQYWFPMSCMRWKANNDFLEILCNRLIQQGSQNCCIPNRSMFGQRDLEEVNVELFDESVAEWRPLPWKTLLDASTSPEKKRKVRFQLKWGLQLTTLR